MERINLLKEALLRKADNQVARARLLASAQPDSGSWIEVIPVPNLGTHLTPEELRIAIALRTGSRICEEHRCKCGKIVDKHGYHLLSCYFNVGRLPRHAAINDIIFRALSSAGMVSELEPEGLNQNDGTRPDGITRFPFSRGRPLCWDATCVDTFAETSVPQNAIQAGSAAANAEKAKVRKYSDLARRFRFEPIAIETLGVFGPTTKIIIQEIGRRIAEKTGDEREAMWLKQRLNIAVQRGNAASILSQANHMTGFA